MSIAYDPRWETDRLLALPFDQYQRYRLTCELLLALKRASGAEGQPWKLLDIGGFFRTMAGDVLLPLPAFAPDDEVLVVDTVAYEGPHYQRASGTELPFSDASVDVAISCDVLEHIPQAGRAAFLEELARVARHAVILAAPHATAGVAQAEAAVYHYIQSYGGTHQMLEEHTRYGLPDPAWVQEALRQQEQRFVTFPSGFLPRWQMLMTLKHLLVSLPDTLALHVWLDSHYNRLFYERDQRGPGYRQVYVTVADAALLPALKPFVERAARPEPEDATAELLTGQVAPLVWALSRLESTNRRLEQGIVGLEQRIVGFEQLLISHIAATAQLEEQVRQGQEAARALGRLEGEKHALQQQIEMLAWQNQTLYDQILAPRRRFQRLLDRLLRREAKRS